MKNQYNKINFKKKEKKNFFSIIIPVYKDPKGIKETLESLKVLDFNEKKYEVIVVNDGGDKETNEVCKKYDVKVLNLLKNLGSYGARNKGLEESQGEDIVFLDADIIVPTNWLKKGSELLKKYDYVGGSVEINKERIKTLAHYYEYAIAFTNDKNLEKENYIPTANLFVRRKIIQELGGFDTRLHSGGDLEFGDRVFRAGKYSMHYSPELKVLHPPRGLQKLLRKTARTREGSKKLFEIYPERFPERKRGFLKSLKIFFSPIYRIIVSKRKIPFLIKLKLFFWSIWFSSVNFRNYINEN